MSYLKIYLILKKIVLTDMLRGEVCASSRRGWRGETPEKVQLTSQSSHKEKMIFPLRVLVSYRHLLFLKEKKEKRKGNRNSKKRMQWWNSRVIPPTWHRYFRQPRNALCEPSGTHILEKQSLHTYSADHKNPSKIKIWLIPGT